MNDNFFITTRGVKIECNPVSDTKIALALAAIEKRYRAEGKKVDKPKYKTVLAGGAEEWYEHDDKSIVGDPEAEKEWDEFLADAQDLIDEQNNKKVRMLLKGLVWSENPDWEINQMMDGIEVPSKPLESDAPDVKAKKMEERWWHFLTTEILETPDDLFNAIEKMTLLTYMGAVSEEAVKAGIANFRSLLQQNSSTAFETQGKE